MDIISRILESNIFLIIYFLIYLWDIFFIGGVVLKLFHLDINSKIEQRVYEFAIGNLIYSYIFHYLGIFHLLYGQLILVIYLFPLFFLIKKALIIKLKYGLKEYWAYLLSIQISLKELLIFNFLLLVFIPLIPSLFAFPASWDALAYHLTLPKLFLQDHYFSFYQWFPQTEVPVGIEALFSFGEVVGDPRLANFISFSFLGALVVYFIYGLRYLFSVRLLLVAVLLFLFRQTLYTEVSVSPFVDFPLSFYNFLIAITFIKFIKNHQWKTLLLLLIFTFFTFLAKYVMGLVLMFATFSVLGIYILFNTVQAKKIIFSLSKSRKFIFILLISVFLFPVIYWMGRNFMYTHNPIYPIFNPYWNKLLPVLNFNEADYIAQMKDLSSGALKPYMVKRLFLGLPIKFPLNEALFSAVLILFSVFGLINGEKIIRYLSGIALLATVLIYLQVGFPSYRYALAAAPILALVSSYIFFNMLQKPSSFWGLLKLPLITLFILSIFFQFSFSFGQGKEFFFNNFKPSFEGLLDYNTAVKNRSGQDGYTNIDYINKNLDKNKDKVLVFFDNRLYYFDVPVEYAQPPLNVFFDNKSNLSLEQIYKDVKKEKFTYFFVNNNWGIPGSLRSEFFNSFVSNYLEPVSTISGTIVYKIKTTIN